MSSRDGAPVTPASWSATQQWLDALDGADAAPPEPHTEAFTDHPEPPPYGEADPTELDIIDLDDPELHDDGGHPEPPTADDPDRPGEFDHPFTRADSCDTALVEDADADADTEEMYRADRTCLGEAAPNCPDTRDDSALAESSSQGPTDGVAPRFNKTVAIGFAAATVVATIVVTATLLSMRTSPEAPDTATGPSTAISVAPAPPAAAPPDAGQDTPIPFTATAYCPPGSTAAQSVAGDDLTQAWVCVRNGADGQTLDIDLGRTMVVTALSITPGWIGADPTGTDQWLQHRVLTRVQWNLFNGNDPATVVAQNTGNVRGEAVQPMPNGGVLASRITLIVQQTSRAPADTAPTTTAPSATGGLLDDVLGAPLAPPPTPTTEPGLPPLPGMTGEQTQTDPADNTFAVSSIKVIGHPPK